MPVEGGYVLPEVATISRQIVITTLIRAFAGRIAGLWCHTVGVILY